MFNLSFFLMIPASPSVSRLIRRDLGSCSHFPCRAELFGWLATSLAEGLLAGATSEQIPQTNKTQKLLNQVLWIIRKIGLVCWKRDRLTCVLGLHLSFFGLCKSERWLWVSANTLIINVFVFVSLHRSWSLRRQSLLLKSPRYAEPSLISQPGFVRHISWTLMTKIAFRRYYVIPSSYNAWSRSWSRGSPALCWSSVRSNMETHTWERSWRRTGGAVRKKL